MNEEREMLALSASVAKKLCNNSSYVTVLLITRYIVYVVGGFVMLLLS